jgi:hypothetical protein
LPLTVCPFQYQVIEYQVSSWLQQQPTNNKQQTFHFAIASTRTAFAVINNVCVARVSQ